MPVSIYESVYRQLSPKIVNTFYIAPFGSYKLLQCAIRRWAKRNGVGVGIAYPGRHLSDPKVVVAIKAQRSSIGCCP